MNSSFIYPELSHTIIGICMKVHSRLGAGLPEVCYSRAAALELDAAHIPYSREFKVLVEYNEQVVGHLVPDLVIDSKIIFRIQIR